MFKWLARRRRKARDIFEYHDGVRTRWIDPLVAYEAIFSDPECNVSRDFADADTDNDAFVRVLAMTCRVFDINEWDEQTPGLTRDEVNTLLSNFFTYMATLKKSPVSLRRHRNLRIRNRLRWAWTTRLRHPSRNYTQLRTNRTPTRKCVPDGHSVSVIQ